MNKPTRKNLTEELSKRTRALFSSQGAYQFKAVANLAKVLSLSIPDAVRVTRCAGRLSGLSLRQMCGIDDAAMSAKEIIEQIKSLSPGERAEVARFIVEQDDSWIPDDFKTAMEDACQGRLVDMDKALSKAPPPHLR